LSAAQAGNDGVILTIENLIKFISGEQEDVNIWQKVVELLFCSGKKRMG